ncbi:MAG: LytTR family DNA-binding domain-containing protein [Pseudomonadales bacterium]
MMYRPVLEIYLRHRTLFEMLLSILITALIITVNATSILLEARLSNVIWDPVQPWVQEITSGLAILLLLQVIFFLRHIEHPFWQDRRWFVARHLTLFLLFASGHLFLMNLFRSLAYPWYGLEYNLAAFNWPLEMLYEGRKDALIYLLLASGLAAYDFILNRLQGEVEFPSQDESEYDQQFLIKMLQREYLVNVNEVSWIQSAKNYVLLYRKGRAYPLRSTMQGVLDRLDPDKFQRCHRTAIVNLSKVTALTSDEERAVLLETGERVPLSKTYQQDIESRLISSQNG